MKYADGRLVLPIRPILKASWILLLLMFMFYAFVGLHPFGETSVESRVEGSAIDRYYVMIMAGLGLLISVIRGPLSWAVAKRSWLMGAFIFWCFLSLGWSEFPDLTLRRTILLVFLTIAAFGLTIGMRNIYEFHTYMMLFLALVMAANIVVTLLFPGYAITDIGVRGFYSQKNVAGMIASVAVYASATWLIGARGAIMAMIGLGALGLSCLFLLMTGSKTSLGLAVGMMAVVPGAVYFLMLGARAQRSALQLTLFLVVFGVLLAIGSNMDRTELLTFLFGDPTFTSRTDIWSFAWTEIVQRPWLGSGYGAFWDVGALEDPVLRAPLGNFLSQVEVGIINQAHNGYLDIWLQAGLPAVLIAICAVFISVWQAIKLCIDTTIARHERSSYILILLFMLVYVSNNAMEATLFERGAFLHTLATVFIFMLHRIMLDRSIEAWERTRVWESKYNQWLIA